MAAVTALKEIVRNGSNLILCHGIGTNDLKEIAAIAAQSGARLTLSKSMATAVVLELSATYKGTITFIDGLNAFKNE